MAVTPARRAALSVLRAASRGRRLDLAFVQEAQLLDDRERRFAHELTYGTNRLRGRLDHLLALRLHRGLDELDPELLDILRLGAYQLLHMEVPDYAAVSQAVELAPAHGAGLVNAVLRAIGRRGEKPEDFPRPDSELGAWLETWGSHPRWLVDRWLSRYPADDVKELVRLNNVQPPLTLLPLAGSPEDAVRRLTEDGIVAQVVGRGTRCVELAAGTDVARALAVLPAIVQDPGASLVVEYAAPPNGGWVADLCAAPGGKSLGLAARGSRVLAADRSERRLSLLRENVVRTGLPVAGVVARAEQPPVASAPLVLLDVPCTGTGTLRRHPDARWRMGPGDPAALAAVQDGILEGGASAVPMGGLLVYSTCTLEPEENQERVDAFLLRHPDFRLEPPDTVDATHLDADGRLAVLPWRTGFDGAFAARLRRLAG